MYTNNENVIFYKNEQDTVEIKFTTHLDSKTHDLTQTSKLIRMKILCMY